MKIQDLQLELIEMGLMGIMDERIKNLHGGSLFFGKLIATIRKKIERNDFRKLSKERFNNFLNLEHKEVLAENEKFYMYRTAGQLFINRLNGDTWEAAKIL